MDSLEKYILMTDPTKEQLTIDNARAREQIYGMINKLGIKKSNLVEIFLREHAFFANNIGILDRDQIWFPEQILPTLDSFKDFTIAGYIADLNYLRQRTPTTMTISMGWQQKNPVGRITEIQYRAIDKIVLHQSCFNKVP